MKIQIEVDIKPFEVPGAVETKISPGSRAAAKLFSLSELDPETLDKLCSDFRKAVFDKAGKRMPPTALPL